MIQLFNRLSGAFEAAELVSPVQQCDIDDYVGAWLPPVQQRVAELKVAGELTHAALGEHNVEDFHWAWPEKWKQRTELRWRSYALRCAGRTQGLMFVDLVRRCRLEPHVDAHFVYIDILSTAPWNRPRLWPAPVYRGVGLVLVTEAIQLSLEEESEGRVGLHALPRSQPFYEQKCLMTNLGPDPAYSNLNYFELSTERAMQFLAR